MSDRILVVDDEVAVVKFLRSCLKTDGYEVLTAINGVDAIHVIERDSPDLLVLDIMMPVMNGFEVLQRLREWSQIPVLILSARHSEEDKVKCLDLGADDYLCKPFGINELVARIRALLRRSTSVCEIQVRSSAAIGELQIDFAKRRVTVAGAEVALTLTEYGLLRELVLAPGKVFTHAELLRRVWGPEYSNEFQYLHVYVSRLRGKIEADPRNPRYIRTVSGMGYMLRDAL